MNLWVDLVGAQCDGSLFRGRAAGWREAAAARKCVLRPIGGAAGCLAVWATQSSWWQASGRAALVADATV